MKYQEYLKEKAFPIILTFLTMFLITSFLIAFKLEIDKIISILILFLIFVITVHLYDYFRKRKFYNNMNNILEKLDQKYLLQETITKPHFYEGAILYDTLYTCNKAMIEYLNTYKYNLNDFKDYIEMWIHEVKAPIASILLITHNHKDENMQKIKDQVKRIENYTEQVLYYVRSENSAQDYLIKRHNLSNIINNVIVSNKDNFLLKKIKLEITNTDVTILTDSKWLEFIINQIINNSIKYINHHHGVIKISTHNNNDKVILTIEVNGIGIPEVDIKKVFNKTFTGYNGHITSKSTGMGLYICQRLCQKLGHKIAITSKQNKYTKVSITFGENNYYDVLK